ncbi:hypothetical protein [Oribacterium sp. C9]|uniref:hypothetical protein n=1 Tax=Oribacterium sp. C9 TaxID=1943579 RepID=UPI001115AA70|nr:hypothetical protein [Oribacterium sp. C9]
MIKFMDASIEDKYKCRLKLAFGKYQIVNNSVIINLEDKDVSIDEGDKEDLSIDFSGWEPSYKNLNNLILHNDSLLTALSKYKKYGLKRGIFLKDIYYKMYWKDRPEEIERSECGRKWIDYEKMLKDNNIVFDCYNQFGIWSTRLDNINNTLSSSFRYGDHLMILRPLPLCKYAVSDLEIVGDKFKTLYHGEIKDPETIAAVIKYSGIDITDQIKKDL